LSITDDVVGRRVGIKHLLDISQEGLTGHRAVDTIGAAEAIAPPARR